MKIQTVIVKLNQGFITPSECSNIKDLTSKAFNIKRTNVIVLCGCQYSDIQIVYI